MDLNDQLRAAVFPYAVVRILRDVLPFRRELRPAGPRFLRGKIVSLFRLGKRFTVSCQLIAGFFLLTAGR